MVKLTLNYLKYSIYYKSISLATTVQMWRNRYKIDCIHKIETLLSFFESAVTIGKNIQIVRCRVSFKKGSR